MAIPLTGSSNRSNVGNCDMSHFPRLFPIRDHRLAKHLPGRWLRQLQVRAHPGGDGVGHRSDDLRYDDPNRAGHPQSFALDQYAISSIAIDLIVNKGKASGLTPSAMATAITTAAVGHCHDRDQGTINAAARASGATGIGQGAEGARPAGSERERCRYCGAPLGDPAA